MNDNETLGDLGIPTWAETIVEVEDMDLALPDGSAAVALVYGLDGDDDAWPPCWH